MDEPTIYSCVDGCYGDHWWCISPRVYDGTTTFPDGPTVYLEECGVFECLNADGSTAMFSRTIGPALKWLVSHAR